MREAGEFIVSQPDNPSSCMIFDQVAHAFLKSWLMLEPYGV
jgi:hypothetical protein